MSRRSWLPLAGAACFIAGAIAFGELAHWRASHRRLGTVSSAPPVSNRSEVIVALGYKNRDRRANYLNRYRVRAALRSIDPAFGESTLIFCGGPVASAVPEAVLMVEYARCLGYEGSAQLETTSRSTWQNIQNAIPLIERFDVIKIVSNSLHAEKARAHLWDTRPDLANRLARGADHRFGELMLVKPVAAARGLLSLRGFPRVRRAAS